MTNLVTLLVQHESSDRRPHTTNDSSSRKYGPIYNPNPCCNHLEMKTMRTKPTLPPDPRLECRWPPRFQLFPKLSNFPPFLLLDRIDPTENLNHDAYTPCPYSTSRSSTYSSSRNVQVLWPSPRRSRFPKPIGPMSPPLTTLTRSSDRRPHDESNRSNPFLWFASILFFPIPLTSSFSFR